MLEMPDTFKSQKLLLQYGILHIINRLKKEHHISINAEKAFDKLQGIKGNIFYLIKVIYTISTDNNIFKGGRRLIIFL